MEPFKKKNSAEQGATWYNTKLFKTNGKPLKFYPKGYNKVEFRSITTIIEAYGGKLSEPTGETIIFAEQDHPVGPHQCYYVKYFQDCIVANKLLDLKKYKLPLDPNNHKIKEESPDHEQVEEKSDGKNDRKPKTNCFDFKESAESNTEKREYLTGVYSKVEDRKIMNYVIGKKLIHRTGSIYFWEKAVADNVVNRHPKSLLDHFRRKLIYDYENYTCNRAACEEFEKILEKREKTIKKIREAAHQKIRTFKWSEEEIQMMMDYIVKNNLIHRMKTRAVSREIIEKAGLKMGRTAFSVRSQIQKLLRGRYEEYITDPQVLREIAEMQNRN